MAKEKYPLNCPWDFGPGQKQTHQDEWTLVNGDQFVKFSKDKHDKTGSTLIRTMRSTSNSFHIKQG